MARGCASMCHRSSAGGGGRSESEAAGCRLLSAGATAVRSTSTRTRSCDLGSWKAAGTSRSSNTTENPHRHRVALPLHLVLPKAQYQPALLLQERVNLGIPSTVFLKLSVPEGSVRFWAYPVLGAAVPLASVHKNCQTGRPEYDIRPAKYGGFYAVAQTQRPQRSSQDKLGLRVPPFDSRHAKSPLLRGENVR